MLLIDFIQVCDNHAIQMHKVYKVINMHGFFKGAHHYCLVGSSGGSRIFEIGVQVQVDYCDSTHCYMMPGRGCRITKSLALVRQILYNGCNATDYPREARKHFGP